MKNDTDVINAVLKIASINLKLDKREKDLARFILKNYYVIDCFFLNKECDYSSGLNLKCVEIFIEKFSEILETIHN